MGTKVNIPIKVVRPNEGGTVPTEIEAAELKELHSKRIKEPQARPQTKTAEPETTAVSEPAQQDAASTDGPQAELEEWRDRALRLQAEMSNYRARQQRLAQDTIEAERQRLLATFLGIVDNLERALAAHADDGEGLRQGVELTHRAALQVLQQEGVRQLSAEGQVFDPNWHEAIATLRTNGNGTQPGMVVQVMEPGYRIGEQLLRPAKVIVSVQ